jgi:hypothetical protein
MDIMTRIREGMHVVDADGKDVGKVRDFQAGDQEAFTVGELNDVSRSDPLVASGGILADTDLPREEVERLSRSGWVRIHKGILTRDHFIPADEVDRVEEDRLVLRAGIHLK